MITTTQPRLLCQCIILVCLVGLWGPVWAQDCYVGGYQADNEFAAITIPDMDLIRSKRILFGHKSIGMNILEGVERLDPMYHLVVEPLTSPYVAGDFATPKLGHFSFASTIGSEKITEFDDLVRNVYGSVVDVAFFKFCYPDTAGTDYQAVFDSYANCLDALRVAYPNVTFVAFTGVLSDDEDISNVRRNQYNQLVRDRYQGVLPLFDVGDIESTKPTDEICTFEYGGETYRKMWPEYSQTDGFHPNAPEIEERLGKGLLVLLDKVLCSGSSAVEYWLLY